MPNESKPFAHSRASRRPRRSYIPTTQRGRADLALRVKDSWLNFPELVFIWTTYAKYATNAVAFDAAVTARENTGLGRAQTTGTLTETDAKIDDGLAYVKGYLAEKFTKARDQDYYDEFGIIHYSGGYILPEGQTKRVKALEKLMAALVKHGLGGRDYGTAFWQPLYDTYKAASETAHSTAQDVTKAVDGRNQAETDVLEVLQALLPLLEAQYRDEEQRDAVRRQLGYLLEFN